MPQQNSPPYLSSAAIWPRTLNRWLDINAQNGPLQRTKTYITVPAFSVAVNWLGYSDIVAAFNFEGPNNFSFTSFGGELPSSPNYMICVMWIGLNNVVHRYSLWNGVGEVMYIPYPLYTGQLVGKNFRIEIWSTDSNPAVQDVPITLYTSKLGIMDYRHGTDQPLSIADAIVTNFNADASNTVALPADIGLLFQVDPYSGLTSSSGQFVSWQSKIQVQVGADSFGQPVLGYPSLIPLNANCNVIPSGVPAGGNCVNITNSNEYLSNSAPFVFWGVQGLVLTVMMTGTEAANTYLFSAYPTGIAMFWNNGTVTTGGAGPNVTGLSQNVWYTFFFYLYGGNATLSVYDTQTGVLIATNTTLAPIVGYTNAIGLGNAPCKILEAIMTSNTLSAADVNQIVLYMQQKYFVANVFTLPLTFPANAVPQFNNL